MMASIGEMLTTIVLMLLVGAYFQGGDMEVAGYATFAAVLFAIMGRRRGAHYQARISGDRHCGDHGLRHRPCHIWKAVRGPGDLGRLDHRCSVTEKANCSDYHHISGDHGGVSPHRDHQRAFNLDY
jgi:hypothetical protein